MHYVEDSIWSYADLDGNDLGSGGTNGYSSSQAGHLVVTGACSISVAPTSFDFMVPLADSARSVLVIENGGTANLTFQILESPGEPDAAPGNGDLIYSDAGAEPTDLLSDSPGVLWDIPWLEVEPTTGLLTPGDSCHLSVAINTTMLDTLDYTIGTADYVAYIVINNNDPQRNPVVVEVRLDVGPLAGVIDDRRIPDTFVLMPNMPNPFALSTCVSYGLPQDSQVRIDVYDVTGRSVVTLVDRQESAGWHSATWRTEAVTPGVYYCRMQAGTYVATRQMIIVK
jgi:hypothetical protein